MTTNELQRSIPDSASNVLNSGEPLLPQTVITMEESSAPKTPVINWSAITAQSFSTDRTSSSDARDMEKRWSSLVELQGLMKTGLAGLEEEIEVIVEKMLANNPKDVKNAAKRASKRIKDLNGRMEMLEKESAVFNDLVKVCSSTSRQRKRVISPPLRSSDKKRKNEEDKRRLRSNTSTKEDSQNMEVEEEQGEDTDFQTVTRKKPRRKVDRPKKAKRDKQKKSQKTRRNDAILIKAKDQSTYADIIKEMKRSVDPKQMDTNVVGLRRSRKNDILIVVAKGSKTENFSAAIQNALKEKAEVTALDYDPVTYVDIRDIEEDTTQEEVISCIEKIIGEESGIKCKMKPCFAGTQMATITVRRKYADQLMKQGRVRIGWTNCRVKGRVNVLKCYKCLCYGHIAKDCQGPDRSAICYKCGSIDHKIADCPNPAACVACTDSGYQDVSHVLGSRECRRFKEEFEKRKVRERGNSRFYR